MPYMTYSQLKDSAKFRLGPIIGKLVGVTAIFYALKLIAGRFSSVFGLFTDSFALQAALSSLFMILAGIFSSMLEIGFRCLMLKLYCGRPVSTGDLFYAFTAQTKTALGLTTVMSLLSTLPLLPAHILFQRVELAMESIALSSDLNASTASLPPELMDLMSIALFCYTPALVLVTVLNLIYSQIYYLMLDFPSFGIKKLFQSSRLLMRGHKGRLFYIHVCVLPVFLIGGIFTCGIGLLGITPFLYAVETEFYLDLVTKRGL
mgnify:CR=1 FL=1